jgi:hypothetical protein
MHPDEVLDNMIVVVYIEYFIIKQIIDNIRSVHMNLHEIMCFYVPKIL